MKSDEELKKENPELYKVAKGGGTEAPFSGKLLNNKENGVYNCAVCGNPLFPSNAKFDSGTGWPSFDEALPNAVEHIEDISHGMIRTEVVCTKCKSHLGHIFGDGSTETGKRYCMNSVCLEFKKEEK